MLKSIQFFSQWTSILKRSAVLTTLHRGNVKDCLMALLKLVIIHFLQNIYTGKRMYVKFNRSCLKQDTITLNHVKIVNIYLVYALNSTLNYDEDITLENCLVWLN